MPTKKEGNDRPSSPNTLPRPSQTLPTRTAAMIPLGIPMISENVIATPASSNEFGKRDQYRSMTGV